MDDIKSHIVKITQLADVGHMILSTKAQRSAEKLCYGQSQISKSQSIIYQKQLEFQQECRSEFNAINRRLEMICSGSESRIKIRQDSTVEISRNELTEIARKQRWLSKTWKLQQIQESRDDEFFSSHFENPRIQRKSRGLSGILCETC